MVRNQKRPKNKSEWTKIVHTQKCNLVYLTSYVVVIIIYKCQCVDHLQFFQVDGDDLPPPKADFSAPPPYDLATKLPSYEEVQREKSLQGELPLPRVS